MKKIISALLSAVLCISSLGVATVHAETEIEALRAENARLQDELEAANEALAHFVLLIEGLSSGDINGDGMTDAVDASLILSYYAYVSTNSPVSLRQFVNGKQGGRY